MHNINLIRSMAERGESQTAIGKALGVSREYARVLLHKHGLYDAWRAAFDARPAVLLKDGSDKKKQYYRIYRSQHREKYAEYQRKRNERLRATPGAWEAELAKRREAYAKNKNLKNT